MKRVLFLSALMLTSAAFAQWVTYEFTGTLTSVTDNYNLFPQAYVGQSFSGQISYTPATQATEEGVLEFTIGTSKVTLDARCLANLMDNENYVGSKADTLTLYTYGSQDGLEFWRCGPTFVDYTCTAFDADSPLPTQLSAEMFDQMIFSVNGNKPSSTPYKGFDLRGEITTLALVPEPVSLLLFGIGSLYLRFKR